MSKAFVNEDFENLAANSPSELFFDPLESEFSKPGAKNYVTPAGLEKLKAELHQLLHSQENERRLQLVQKRMESAEVIVPENQSGDRVLFGATVSVRDENEKSHAYQIVGVDETDLAQGKISWISPIAKALLQARVGDVVFVQTPHGDEELEVEKIEFKPIL